MKHIYFGSRTKQIRFGGNGPSWQMIYLDTNEQSHCAASSEIIAGYRIGHSQTELLKVGLLEIK